MTIYAAVGWLLALLWAAAALPVAVFALRRTFRRLAGREPALENPPSLAVVVPARDEAAAIGTTLRSLLASDYPRLEIVAVDDRSEDGTGARMRAVADENESGGLRVLTIESLPDGWLGKCHACDVAQRDLDAEWILFTDGDVTYSPDALSLAMRYAVGRGLDFLTLVPRARVGGFFESLLVGGFALAMFGAGRAWLMPYRWSNAAVGAGPFLLVRAAAYRASGGHAGVRLAVVEDVELARQMKSHGGRADVLVVGRGEEVSFRWQPSAWGVITGLTKNAFAAVDYSWPRLAVGAVFLSAVTLLPYAGFAAVGEPGSAGYFVAVAIAHGSFAAVAWAMALPVAIAPLLPLAIAGMLFAFFRSAAITTRAGGVRWRETFYSLETLREFTAQSRRAPRRQPGDGSNRG